MVENSICVTPLPFGGTPAIRWHPCHSVAPLPFGGTPAFLWQMVLYVYNTFGFMIHCVEPLQPIVSYPVQY
jgi:hypothetical protein